jgi:hypothetical protein
MKRKNQEGADNSAITPGGRRRPVVAILVSQTTLVLEERCKMVQF